MLAYSWAHRLLLLRRVLLLLLRLVSPRGLWASTAGAGAGVGADIAGKNALLLPAYSRLQAQYWNVQFAGQWLQWPPRQLPNILLGLPMLLVGTAVVVKTFGHVFFSGASTNKSVHEVPSVSSRHRSGSGGMPAAVTLSPVLAPCKISCTSLCNSLVSHVEVLHLAVLCAVAALWAHVQIATRMLTFSCPVVWVLLGWGWGGAHRTIV